MFADLVIDLTPCTRSGASFLAAPISEGGSWLDPVIVVGVRFSLDKKVHDYDKLPLRFPRLIISESICSLAQWETPIDNWAYLASFDKTLHEAQVALGCFVADTAQLFPSDLGQ